MISNRNITYLRSMLVFLGMTLLVACSTTSSLEPDEQLYAGMKPIKYVNYKTSDHFYMTQEEMEAALAAQPNGALFGSPYYRTPFPYGLWIWNAFSDSDSPLAKWFVNSFGKAPVIMGDINPELRTSVGESVLQNHGYFRGKVDYTIVEGKPKTTKTDSIAKPRSAKIAYTVDMGPLYTLDSIEYHNFHPSLRQMVQRDALLKRGDAFDIAQLDAERTRIYSLFRNNGFYYYEPSYTSYRADTMMVPTKVQLQLHLADSLPERVLRRYVIGNTDILLRQRFGEQLADSVHRRRFAMFFNGKKTPVRPRVILNKVKLRPRQLFSQDNYQESLNGLTSTGIFSNVEFSFTPRAAISNAGVEVSNLLLDDLPTDTLDMQINCVLDKPYDVTMEANYKGKTTGRMGPGVALSFAKRNAFRGGEVLSLNLGANYEFQTGQKASFDLDNYELSGDVTLEMPRLVMPFMKSRRRWQTTPTTLVRLSAETINRAAFFRNNIVAGELSYMFHPSLQTRHQWSPLIFEYNHIGNITDQYYDKLTTMLAIVNSKSRFVPKMRYTYNYTSPLSYRNPISIGVTLSEAGNVVSAARMLIGKGWDDKNKTLFHTEYSQFVKAEVEVKKTWHIGEFNTLVARVMGGFGHAYGNSSSLPFSELFYVGGANDLRSFSAHTVGPGSYHADSRDIGYVLQTGNVKFVGNLEYRPRLFGSLYGALFCDVGNVWRTQQFDEGSRQQAELRLDKLADDLAVGVGVGVRYDLDFFVLRLDWGFALHTPYSTGRSGYFNIPSFRKAQCLNFAIGYPF